MVIHAEVDRDGDKAVCGETVELPDAMAMRHEQVTCPMCVARLEYNDDPRGVLHYSELHRDREVREQATLRGRLLGEFAIVVGYGGVLLWNGHWVETTLIFIIGWAVSYRARLAWLARGRR